MVKKSILIIGGGGFFGKSIIDLFLKKKNLQNKINKIIIITKSSKNYIHPDLKKNYQIIQIKKDISKAKIIPFANYILYCATTKNSKEDNKGVKNYFQLAKKYHTNSNIVYTSSGAVYGKQPKKILRIKDSFGVDLNQKLSKSKKSYALQKIKNEKFFKELSNYGIKVSIARCFTFVGKNLPLNKNYVIGNFIDSILNKKEIIVKSKIKVIRSYMHSDDLADCLLKLVFRNTKNFNTYNIGAEKPVDIHKLAMFLSNKYDLKCITPYKIINDDEDRYVPSIKKFRIKFKYKKKNDSYAAIFKTIKELSKID